ncbi:MAG: hypothetical protein J5606_06145 [Bacteroidales bacterium]|nr:hypothetical protein [Bacteroidales bacterium]
MVSLKKNISIVLFIMFSFCITLKSQNSVKFVLTEVEINNISFLNDLDSILQKYCVHCVESNDFDSIYLVTFKQIKDCVYDLIIEKQPRIEDIQYVKFFFKFNGYYYFVNGELPNCPSNFFNSKCLNQTFTFKGTKKYSNSKGVSLDADGECCILLLKCFYQVLFYKETIW